MIKRVAYLFYYLKEVDKSKLRRYINYVYMETGKSKISIWKDIIYSSIKYNISILEYFNFQFYKINEEEKRTFAGTGFMYEYQLLMNPKKYRIVLEDKLAFLKEYEAFVRHSFIALKDIELDDQAAQNILENRSGKLVLKDSKGQCGIGIQVIDVKGLNSASLAKALRDTNNDFVEEFVIQHNSLMQLSPSGLNTIRIITQLNNNNGVDILGCRLRITINSSVDNLAAGNIAATIDEVTGKLTGPGVYSDITKKDEYYHPVTGIEIIGFQVPFWKETIQMVKQAALVNTHNRSIGWDVAITRQGPELIEGNHDWCKLLWQLPAKRGLKPILESYLNR